MNAQQAVHEIIWQGFRRRSSHTSAVKAFKALKALGLTNAEALNELTWLEYTRDILVEIPELKPLIDAEKDKLKAQIMEQARQEGA